MAIKRFMLRDFVIVQSLELDLADGFTVLTGETGAGKSILIDALQCLLGARADTAQIREGANRAEVGAEFDLTPRMAQWLDDAGFPADFGNEGELMLRRTVDREGKSRAWINGSPATATQLRELADFLVDIHGQHAWQSLTRPDSVRALLDAYAQLDTNPMSKAWQAWRAVMQQLDSAKAAQSSLAQTRERLAWQVGEIDKLAPQQDEWQLLNQEHARLANAQALLTAAQTALHALAGTDSDDSAPHALRLMNSAAQALESQSAIESAFAPLLADLASSCAAVQDAAHTLQSYLHKTELDPARLELLDNRLSEWLSLSRRFKCTPEELHGFWRQSQEALIKLDADNDLDALEKQEKITLSAFTEAARKVSERRCKAAPLLAQAITDAMQELGMTGGVFEVTLKPNTEPVNEPRSHGLESAEFLVAGHAGTAPKPVSKVASGGELSRIALAIAVTTSKLGSAPTLIFDEVDAGIGGATAQTVGRLMQQLGADRQVLAVTHLPQVAACAHHHGVVSKSLVADRVASRIEMVGTEAREREIARMLGGEVITDAALNHARELLA